MWVGGDRERGCKGVVPLHGIHPQRGGGGMAVKSKVLIVGGGTAGITTASRLRNAKLKGRA
jgi:hypothetical protein